METVHTPDLDIQRIRLRDLAAEKKWDEVVAIVRESPRVFGANRRGFSWFGTRAMCSIRNHVNSTNALSIFEQLLRALPDDDQELKAYFIGFHMMVEFTRRSCYFSTLTNVAYDLQPTRLLSEDVSVRLMDMLCSQESFDPHAPLFLPDVKSLDRNLRTHLFFVALRVGSMFGVQYLLRRADFREPTNDLHNEYGMTFLPMIHCAYMQYVDVTVRADHSHQCYAQFLKEIEQRERIYTTVLESGKIDVHKLSSSGANLLHYNFGRTDPILYKELVVEYGLDVNQQDVRGRTPLMVAEHQDYERDYYRVTLLLCYGANPWCYSERYGYAIGARRMMYTTASRRYALLLGTRMLFRAMLPRVSLKLAAYFVAFEKDLSGPGSGHMYDIDESFYRHNDEDIAALNSIPRIIHINTRAELNKLLTTLTAKPPSAGI